MLTADGVPIAVSLSIGIAAGALYANRGWHALHVQADAALYRAKSGGRDRIEWASERPPRGAAA
jgi:PleD family two-component response regulator